MKKLWGVVAILAGILPATLHAEAADSKKPDQSAPQDAELAAIKLKLARDTTLTDDQRNAMLADWMKHHPRSGPAHTDKNLELSQKTAAGLSPSQMAAMQKQALPPRNSVQVSRPQSKAVNKTGPAKASSAETTESRNVLVP
jgi:hypothetical protein